MYIYLEFSQEHSMPIEPCLALTVTILLCTLPFYLFPSIITLIGAQIFHHFQSCLKFYLDASTEML